MYNLFEYSDNYSDTSRTLWSCKRDEIDDVEAKVTNDDNAHSFKHKTSNIGNTEADGTEKRSRSSCTTKIFK